ncbi:hypothetical protein LJR090_002893 [Bosea sp. LjRoot90]|uniref:hypothetical protein n=1 Tax=Bosea sp. LjRoot90 TaxID=3342342 RepID=UPI003ECC3B17
MAEFTRAYLEECNRSAADTEHLKADTAMALSVVQRKIDGIMHAIEGGLYQPSMKQRLAELEREQQSLNLRLSAPTDRPTVLVHPNLAEAYRRRVAELESLLEDPELRDEAIAATSRSLWWRLARAVASRSSSVGIWHGFWRCARTTQKPRFDAKRGFC